MTRVTATNSAGWEVQIFKSEDVGWKNAMEYEDGRLLVFPTKEAATSAMKTFCPFHLRGHYRVYESLTSPA